MVVYGYVKAYRSSADNASEVQVRIPSIHGPYNQADANGKSIKNYTRDEDLPWYPSLVLNHEPTDGEVVALLNEKDSSNNTDLLVIGFTGATYQAKDA